MALAMDPDYLADALGELVIKDYLSILPHEILFQILPYASGAYYSLCLTSRWLNIIVEPFLYRAYVLKEGGSMLPLLRTLFARPELALYVQYLKISYCDPDGWEDPLRGYPPWIRKNGAWKDQQDAIINQCFNNHGGAGTGKYVFASWAACMIIRATKNLEQLDIEYSHETEPRYKLDIGNEQVSFSKLKILNEEYSESWDSILDFGSLSSIPTLEQYSVRSMQYGVGLIPWDPDVNSIRQLDLFGFLFEPDDLAVILAANRRLQVFRCALPECNIVNHLDDGLEPYAISLDCDTLSSFLEAGSRFTLEVLVVDFEDAGLIDMIFGTCMLLKDMQCLKAIDLPFAALFGTGRHAGEDLDPDTLCDEDFSLLMQNKCHLPKASDCLVDRLPSTLETLVVRLCGPEIVPQMWNLLNQQDAKLPRLKGVALTIGKGLEELDDTWLAEAFIDNGIEYNTPRLVRRAHESHMEATRDQAAQLYGVE